MSRLSVMTGAKMRAAGETIRGQFVQRIAATPPGVCAVEQPIPCVELCPANVDIPGYIALISAGRCDDAVHLIRKDNPFPTACALICEHPCEMRCRRRMIDDEGP